MSGFVALLRADGAPADGELVGKLTETMAYRGPDARSTWTSGSVGLGYALFATTDGPADNQPADLDGRLWIAADARIDDRDNLVRKLAAVGRQADLRNETDARLILHAYDVWGDDCLWHLLGAYAFALWDEPRKRLFCARDHIGVKPFYYTTTGSSLLVGNTLAALRAHPEISDDLDELSIADYLLFGINRFPERTSFAAIRRLPPAHSLSSSTGGAPTVRRYWELNVTEPVRYPSEREHVDRFVELLDTAVADRLRGPKAGILLSGGLDSTSIAERAATTLSGRYVDGELVAFTFQDDRLHEDHELAYASRVADAIGAPIHRLAADPGPATEIWGDAGAWSAEPADIPMSLRLARLFERSCTQTGVRVGLTGQGGDPLLQVFPEDFAHEVGRRGWLRAGFRMWSYRRARGHLPRVGLRTLLRRRQRPPRAGEGGVYPPWMHRGLERRLALRQRFEGGGLPLREASALRPEAQAQLTGPDLVGLLEWYDAGSTGFRAEWRHPYLDVRLVEHALALPPVPWLAEKEIVRRAMTGRLPDAVVARRKAAVAGFPVHRTLMDGSAKISGLAAATPGLAEFVDIPTFLKIARRPERLRPSEYELITRPLGLALWLRRLASGPPSKPETRREEGR